MFFSVRALKGKRIELSTPKSVYIFIMALIRHAKTLRSKDKKDRVTKRVRVSVALRVQASVCMSIQLLKFLLIYCLEFVSALRYPCT